jgi:hypothetical protein
VVDFAMPIRLWGSSEWLTPEQLIKAQATNPQAGAEVSLDGPNGVVHQVRFNRDAGYALEHYKLIQRDPREFSEIDCSDFREIQGVFVPFEISAKSVYTDRLGRERRPWAWKATVEEFILDDPKNTEASMAITWPAGTQVLDNRNNFTIPAVKEARVLTDADIAREMEIQARSQQDLELRARQRMGQPSPAPATSP